MKKYVLWVMISMVVCGSLSSCKKEKKNAPAGQRKPAKTNRGRVLPAAFRFIRPDAGALREAYKAPLTGAGLTGDGAFNIINRTHVA